MPTVSAGQLLKECKERSLRPFFFFFKLVNSLDDFCIFAPPDPGPASVIGATEVRRIGHISEKEYD